MDEIRRVRQHYERRAEVAQDSSYMWHPRNVVGYSFRQANERAVIGLLEACDVDLDRLGIVDVGCGDGNLLRFLVSLGAGPHHCCGVDLTSNRIERARAQSHGSIGYYVADARHLPFPSATFGLAAQMTLFSSILSASVRQVIAREIERVLRPGGYLLWHDMTKVYGESTIVRGVGPAEVKALFPGYRWLAQKRLFYRLRSRIVRRSWLLAEIVEKLPITRHTHSMVLLQKP